jgi:ribosomal protein L37E
MRLVDPHFVNRVADRVRRCGHLTVDEGRERFCLLCGYRYDRREVLDLLREAIRERHRLPPSPWSAEERSADPS